VITIDPQVCNGCATCVEVCPSGAIYLVEGKATVDQSLCNDCEACFGACPTGAIAAATPDESIVEAAGLASRRPEAIRQPESNAIQVQTATLPVPSPSRALPVVGAALAWAGREIVPWLADLALEVLDRRAGRPRERNGKPRRECLGSGGPGGGRKRRRRRRGGDR
jgi:NAD-dependent dihydropyrimidine dehydrogenase PreA subunit